MSNYFSTFLLAASLVFVGIALSSCDQPDPAIHEEPADYTPNDWLAKSLPEIAEGISQGEVNSEDLVSAYLNRIEQIDRTGPDLQSVLSLNPNALEEARAADAARYEDQITGPLNGVPILLKDNIESADPLPTTAGALALKDNVTGRDSPLVKGLREQGAIILGKTNLSQWANFRSNSSMSGWSALGGQVRNPHMLDRNPCGSSSGSGVAVAASLAAGAVGTETNGSIICPSNINGIVGFKPTVGLVSQQYIIPISSTQDTAGPMTKTVKGAAMMLGAMASGPAKTNYVAALDAEALKGARIGVLRFAEGSSNDVKAIFNAALEDMEANGAILVEIEEGETRQGEFWSQSFDVLKYEFKATLNDYLAGLPGEPEVRSLEELIVFNTEHADTELALFDQSIFDESQAMGSLEDPAYQEALAAILKATREDGIDKIIAEHKVDILVSPSGPIAPRVDPVNGDVWPAWAGAGGMAAVAGYPHASVPAGFTHGLPSSISFIGGKDQDAQVLSFAYAYEQATQHRRDPAYLKTAQDRLEIKAAMDR